MGVKRTLDLCVAEEYLDRDRNRKIKWNAVGRMVELDDGKNLIKLNIMPGLLIHGFPQKQKVNADTPPQGRPTPQQQVSNRPANAGTTPAPDDLPF